MVDGRTLRREMLIGAQTRTTVTRMELGVYTSALAYHYYGILNRIMTNAPYRTWIFSDSELTVKCGNKEYARKTNVDLWAGLDALVARGYDVRFRWVPRNSTPFHAMADELAGTARVTLNNLQLPDESLYEYMPLTDEIVDEEPTLATCPACRTPLSAAEKVCPICGHKEDECPKT